ncbi:MAG: tetratricopeptide repeat protein [Anaerolineae bacterium]|nr:tetratricopeptide repeat protein [Anaerolineae bacterium]
MITGQESSNSQNQQWQNIWRQQAAANGRRWLSLLEQNDDPGVLFAHNYEAILLALEKLLDDPEQLDIAMALIKIVGKYVFAFGDWERWAVYLEKALWQMDIKGDEESKAYLLARIGNTFYVRGDWNRALQLAEDVAALYKKSNHLAEYSTALSNVGMIQIRLGHFQQGMALSQEALQIAQQLGSEEHIAQVNWNLASTYEQTHHWEEALVTAQQAYRYYQKENSLNVNHELQNIIITTSGRLGRWDEVAELSQTLMASLAEAGEINKLALLKLNLGVIAFEQTNYARAEQLWYEALQLYSQMQKLTDQAPLYNNLGHLYTQTGEWETAETYLQEAITIYAHLGYVYNQADTLDNLAECYRRQNKIDAYQQSLDKAIRLLEQADASAPYYQSLLLEMRQKKQQI